MRLYCLGKIWRSHSVVQHARVVTVVCVMSIIIMIFLLSGCTGGRDREHEVVKSSGDIIIGAVWPFSLKQDMFGEGAELAVEEINAAGGLVGRKLQLVKVDNEGVTAKGKAAIWSLTSNRDLLGVIGGGKEAYSAAAMATVCDNAGVPMLSTSVLDSGFAKTGRQNTFRSLPPHKEIMSRMVQVAAERGYRRVVIYYHDHENSLANDLENMARERGITVVDRIGREQDFSGFLSRWTALGFDAVFVLDTMPQGATFIAKARKVGVTVPFIGGVNLDSPEFIKIAGQAGENVTVISFFDPNTTQPETVKFITAFQKKYGILPDIWAAQGYDNVYLLASVVTKRNSVAPDQIAESLKSSLPWQGITGKVAIEKTVHGGKFDYIPVIVKYEEQKL